MDASQPQEELLCVVTPLIFSGGFTVSFFLDIGCLFIIHFPDLYLTISRRMVLFVLFYVLSHLTLTHESFKYKKGTYSKSGDESVLCLHMADNFADLIPFV